MLILLLFAFISGLITILAPCIWPLLPIILSSTTSGGHRKPLGITLGIMTSFAFFTLTLSYIVKIFPFDPDILRIFAVVVIGFLGLTLVVPKLNLILEGFVSRLSSRFAPANPQDPTQQKTGFVSGYVTGFSLGLVWSPCAGPILATIATLAATQALNWQIVLVTLVYVAGIGVPLFIFASVGSAIFNKSRLLSPYTARIQQIFGIIMILTAFAIATGYDRVLQANLLDKIPAYSNFLYKLEGQEGVKKELERLKKGDMPSPSPNTIFSPTTPMDSDKQSSLPNYGLAPDFVGIFMWLNSEPLTLQQLKGKVVLVDFWTYTCINCIRTLPYVTSWYEKYKDKGFVVVGVHTPEFEFEKKTENVEGAIKQYKITYPVAQDNNYQTWRAYDNHYWPAKYLIDHKGSVRYFHFGEGKYEETEENIQKLLKEAGLNGEMDITNFGDQTPKVRLTPETYLGLERMENFSSKENPKLGTQNYTLPSSMPKNSWAFGGPWDIQEEYSQSTKNSTLELKFYANKVFLVITPATNSDTIKITLDGKETELLNVTESKLYTIVNLDGTITSHLLHLDFLTGGTKIYAFTFGD